MNDTVEAWSKVVTDRVGLPIDVWAVAAVLESEGLRDHDARARFGEAHLFALAQAVYRHAIEHAPAVSPAALPVENETPRLRRLARDLGESALLTLPLVTQLACGALFNHSLVAARGLSARDAVILPGLDELITQSRQSLDEAFRDKAMREAQKLWMEDAPWLMTVYPQTFESMAPNIVGWVPHPDEHERWVDLKIG